MAKRTTAKSRTRTRNTPKRKARAPAGKAPQRIAAPPADAAEGLLYLATLIEMEGAEVTAGEDPELAVQVEAARAWIEANVEDPDRPRCFDGVCEL